MRRVTAIERLKVLPASLTHASVSGPVDLARHASFIALRLGLGALALVGATLWLAMRGLDGGAEAAALAFACTPLLALIVASRTGDLARAAALGVAGLAGLSLSLAVAAPAYAPVALALLLTLPLEGASAGAPRLVWAGAFVALVALAAGWRWAAPEPAGLGFLAMSAGAVAICASACAGLLRLLATARAAGDARAAHYEALSEALGDCVLRMDRTGAVLRAEGGSAETLALSPRDLMGRGLFERIHVGDRPAFLKSVSDAASGAGAACLTLRLRTGASSREQAPQFGWAELRVQRIAGGADEALCVLRDAAARMEREDVMAQAREDSQRAARAKDRFLATISHELRTPLNAIIGFSEMLASENLSPAEPARARDYAQVINESGHHLLSVVNAILDVSKMEAGAFALAPEPLDAAPLVEQCCDMVGLKAQEKGVTLVRDAPAGLPALVADKRAVKQILINLISNALKFTPANGRVLVRVRPEGASLVLSVIDTGVGVAARDLDRLGAPFFQAQGDYDRQYEGAGLGLSVVRGLVGLHGGTMRFESAPGEGALACVKLPLDCRAVPESARKAQAPIETLARGPAGKAQAFARQSQSDDKDHRVKRIA